VANIKSQIKRNKQNDKRRLRNRVFRGTARLAVKNARTTIDEGVPESKEALINAISALDKAAEQGVLHKNNAARRKSRLMKAFAKMEPAAAPVEAPAPAVAAEAEVKPAPRKRAAKPKAEAPAEPKPAPKAKKAPAKKPAAKKKE